MVRFFWTIAFFGVATSVFAGETLTALVTAAQDFSVAIQEQLTAVQSDISATLLVEKTLSYAKAKTAYYNALRAEMPEMTDIATEIVSHRGNTNGVTSVYYIAFSAQAGTIEIFNKGLVGFLSMLGFRPR
jgi:hypothetical protein